MSSDLDLQRYLDDATSWDADRLAQLQRTARIAWWTAAGGWSCALAAAAALVLLMPLKRVEPFVVRVDSSTGIVDAVPIYTGASRMDESISRYFLAHYVSVCERFNFATAESDYEECGAFHSAERNQAWYALWSATNPSSPLNVYKNGTTVRVQVQSVSFFERASGVADLAQVRYLKAERQGTAAERATHWIATLQYAFGAPSREAKVRRWNPLGFKVIEFKTEPEVLAAPESVEAQPTSQGPTT
jgi:type IV secretion system protein VirB8